jgi:hypothetical protein
MFILFGLLSISLHFCPFLVTFNFFFYYCPGFARTYVRCHFLVYVLSGRFQWPLGLRCGSAASLLLWLRVRIQRWHKYLPCVLPGRPLCVGLIARPEKSYRKWCVQLSVGMNPRQWGGPGSLEAVVYCVLQVILHSVYRGWQEHTVERMISK